jgi:hypothetical protein
MAPVASPEQAGENGAVQAITRATLWHGRKERLKKLSQVPLGSLR